MDDHSLTYSLTCCDVQERDLERLRRQWLAALTKRQEYLDQHLQSLVSKAGNAPRLDSLQKQKVLTLSVHVASSNSIFVGEQKRPRTTWRGRHSCWSGA